MKPVPQARQTSTPGARLVKGALLNRIAEALQARTPLNAKSSTGKGYTGAARQGGVPAQGGQALPRYESQRTYVIASSFVQRLVAALRARLPSDGVTRGAPIQANAAGIEALIRALTWVTPAAFEASTPSGYRLPSGEDRLASMIVEFERKAVLADMCSLDVREVDEVYVTKETTVNTFEHGTQTITITAAGNIRTWQESGEPTACEAPVYDVGSTAGLGDFVSSAFTEETHPFSEVWAAAVAALAGATATTPTQDFGWPEGLWQATTAPGGWSYSLGRIGCSPTGGDAPTRDAATYRWRVKNTGQCHIKLFWERRLEEDDSVLASGSLNIGMGRTSDWQEPPATPTDPDARMYVTLSAIQLGAYR